MQQRLEAALGGSGTFGQSGTYPFGRLVEPIAERCRAAGVEAESVVTDGPPAATVLDLADAWGATVIAIGTHGRRGVARVLVGSVAEAVLRRAKVPLLVVPVRDHGP